MKKVFLFLLVILFSQSIFAQSVTVTQPNGGELMYGCQPYTIKWNSSGVSNNWDIYYSLDGGIIWSSVATNINITNGQYNWTVPMYSSALVKVKVVDHNALSKKDSSDANFTINLPINVTSPNGGEVWQGLSTHTISWIPAGTSGFFNLYYSVNNGSTWNTITTNLAANNYTWTVPNNPSTQSLVKVQDATTACQMDISNAVFEISPATPILTAPNGGEIWTINSNRSITWNTATFYTNVMLEYSTDNGASYNMITNSTSNTGSYSWTIPNTPTTQALVKASNATGSTVNDVSNSAFTIQLPTDFITAPNGGETWRSGNTHNITWNSSVFASNVKIEYSLNNGTSWNTIIASTTNTGTYAWTIPQMETNNQALVRITNLTVPTIVDVSNSVFTILAPVTVDSPNTSANLTGCSTISINWSRTDAFGNSGGRDDYSQYRNSYELYYSVNGGPYNSITTIMNTHAVTYYTYNWVVPDVAPGNIRIKIVAKWYNYSPYYASTFWTDSSDVAAPVVNPPGTITVSTPNGGVTLNALTNYNITWTATGTTGFFDVQYSVNDGTNYSTIASNITGNSYTWNVNNTPSTNVFVKVRDYNNNCRKDASDAANTIIAATPILTSPNGGEVWYVNSSHNITWTSSTLYSNVNLEFSADNGNTWNVIGTNITNNGSYNWTVPASLTTQALIRISNYGTTSNYDISNSVFTIQNPVDFLTYPNGGETLRSLNSYNITWNASVFTSSVKLEYTLNNGSTWNVITNSASNSGSYSWSLPQTETTTQALVRITNTTVTSITDVSNAVFTILAPVTVDNPNTSANLTGCSTISINWSRTDAFGNYGGRDDYSQYRNSYELYYSVNGGPYNSIATIMNTHAVTSYNYNWVVPDVAPGNIRIKIVAKWYNYSPYYASTFWTDSSDVAAPVVNPSGTITVSTPNGGATLNALTNYNVTWTASGTTGFFDVLYSVNGGANYSTIASNLSGNSYTWNINNTPSTNVYVKVRDYNNNCRKDASDAANTIVAATPILTSPNGGEVWKVNSTQNITWTQATIYSNVNIEYSTDNGVSWNIVASNLTNNGSYSWTVPNTITTQALIRISNTANSAIFDVSNAPFTINLPTPLLTSPNGGETWRSLNTQNITWDASTVASNVKIEYSLNNGTTWNLIVSSASNTGSYSWSLPQTVTTTQALVRLTNTSFPSAIDTSNAVFTILAPVTVDNPNTSANLTGCSTISINWSRTDAFGNYGGRDDYSQYRNSYELYYSVNGGPYNSITTIMNTHAVTSYNYNWVVPDVAPGNIRIKIVAKWYNYSPYYASTFWTDSSDVAAPVVNPPGTITVSTPNGGVTLNALTNYNVTWTASGTTGFFDVLYSVNGGANYTTIASNLSGNSYAWNVNNNPSTNVFVKVRDYNNNCRKDISDAANTIVAATPILTSPNGGEVWKVNSTQNITWTQATLYSTVNIEYSSDNGVSWNIVASGVSNNGSYSWTVPNTITSQALIRISNSANSAIFDVSNAPFTINLPTPLLTSPNGGETWRSLNTQNITWDASTVASNVKIEYSLNNGTTWNLIVSSASNTGTYSWSLPQTVTTTQALVRLTNTSFPTAIDTSNAVFTILAPVTVDNPNTSANLTGCSTISINWSRTDAFGNSGGRDDYSQYRNSYELYYSVNGGPYNSITTIMNTHAVTYYSYNWVVPDVAPGNIRIKIVAKWYNYSPYYASTFWTDSSDVVAPVVNPPGTITVSTPNGGVTLNALTNYNVTWTASGTTGFFDVLYSVNGGTNYSTIASNLSGNSYSWNVNNTPSTNVFVKVRDYNNNCRKDASDAANTIIAATPILTSPNGGEVWYVNSSHNITWTSTTLYTNVNLEFSADNGSTWNVIGTNLTNNGSYNWTVPANLTTQALIRISNYGTTSNYDLSNSVFTIQNPVDFLTYPNGGETLRSLNSYNITWNASVFTSNVKLEYTLNNGSSWNTITNSASNSGSYSWSLPQTETTTQALVRITNTTVTAINDISNATFTILSPVTVDNPNTAANLTGCSTISINWSRTDAFGNSGGRDDYSQYRNSYELYYSVNGGPYNSITTVMNTHAVTYYSYNWVVPDVAPGNIRIKIVAKWYNYSPYYASTFWTDSSDVAAPVINPPGTITVTNPNGGVTLNALTNYNVTWTATGTTGFFDVLYSTNGGNSYSTIASNLTGNSYSWNVNNTPSTNVFVKVRDYNNNCRKDISDANNIIIAATPILTSPNGGEVWNVNSTQNITWNSSTLYSSAFLEYTLDNGVTWNNIIASTTNNGSYNWTVPFTPSAQAKVRISNVSDPSLSDVSNNNFTIQIPTAVVTSPNGGETWYAGTVQNITWLPATFFSSTVNLEYSLDGGTTWNTIANNQTNSGTYAWTLPNVNSANALIKVSNSTNTAYYDVSNALLTLRPYVRLITPNGGDLLGSCTQTTITFERAPGYSSFNIEYSTDNGSNWNVLQSNQTYSNTINNYSWTIPNAPSTQCLVRVYPYGAVNRADQSDAVFTIKRAVTIIQPNYGGVLVVGSSYPIKWQSDGISNVYDIAYCTTSPTGTYTNIVLGYNTSNNTYNWTVPNTPSTTCYLRIRDNINSCKEDISDMAFTIASTANPITVTAPNGGDTLSACQSYNITWTESSSPIGNYNISYSIDYGTNWVPIVSNYITTSGLYNWTVPNITSNGVLIRVQSGLNPLVFDYSNALFVIKPGRLYTNNNTSICSGSSLQLNTTGGSNYSWSPTTGLSNPTIPNPVATPPVTTQYTVTSVSGSCFLQDTILITVVPNSGLTAGVSISPSTSTAICSGTPVLFTAVPTNGGSAPSYQWKLNGNNVGTNTYTYSNSSLATNDIVSCVMTSSLQCVSNSPATSNAVTMTVMPSVTPAVSISTPLTTICSGTNVVFTALPVNGGGSPVYQWKKNSTNVGINSNTYTDNALSNNDVISVEMTSNASCASTTIVNSNSVLMTVNQTLTPTVVISAPTTSICSGASLTFTAVASNAGSTPMYQWKVDGSTAGTNSAIFATSALSNNSVVTCEVTSSASCSSITTAVSNQLTIQVNAAPAAPVASSNTPVTTGSTINLFASTISGANYTWTGPGGFSSSSQNPSRPNATTGMAGIYSVAATVNNCTGPAGTTTVIVNTSTTNIVVSGTVMTETGSFVSGVKVKRTGASVDSLTTPANGQYSFNLTQGSNYTFTPSKNNDVNIVNGITTLDIVMMQRHILNTQLLNSPYKIIAADVNGSGTVTNMDIVLTKSLILQNTMSFPTNKMWTFVNSSYVFPNQTNPFPYESVRAYSSAVAAIDQNFVAIKVGDVNNSWDPAVLKATSTGTVAFEAGNRQAQEGDIITIPVRVNNFTSISGFQFSMTWNSSVLEFQEANNAALDMSYGTLHTSEGTLTTLWSTEDLNGNTLQDGSIIFELKFKVLGHAGESSAVSINSELTSLEAYNNNLESLTCNVNEGIVDVISITSVEETGAGNFGLMQNNPNPFSDKTEIIFSIPDEGQYDIAIYDVIGTRVRDYSGSYSKGKQTIIWDGSNNNGMKMSNGTYYFMVRDDNEVRVRKMILIK